MFVVLQYLCDGGENLLARLYNKSLATKGEYIEEVKVICNCLGPVVQN